MGKLILILGGARSGKSSYAQRLALELGDEHVLFVATAEAGDEEMRERIVAHQYGRPAGWRTVEAPQGVAAAVQQSLADGRVVLLDCVTLWVSNILLALGEESGAQVAEKAVLNEVERFLETVSDTQATFIAVTNEVGLGVVPAYSLGRLYRDLLGRANQALAAKADHVTLLIAGLPIDLRALLAISMVSMANLKA